MHPGGAELEIARGSFAKLDEEERLAFGWASVVRKDGQVPVGWWVGFHVADDEVWKAVKSGRYSMFSIYGKGVREEVDGEADGVVDSQGEIVDLASLEKAAYEAVKAGLIGDEMHERDLPDVRVVESVVLTPEKLEAMGVTA